MRKRIIISLIFFIWFSNVKSQYCGPSSNGSGGGGGGSDTLYTGKSPTNVTVGALSAGTIISGLSFSQIIQDMTNTYLTPAFASFTISGLSQTIEVGTTISGTKTFNWSISNSSNVQPNTNAVRDVTANVLLSSGLPNTGSTTDPIGTITENSPGSYSWRGEAENTLLSTFVSSNFTVTWLYYIFFGPSASPVTTSSEVRALGSSQFTNGSDPFILNTGSTDIYFVAAMPVPHTITQVLDLDALDANITSQYILSTFNVLDAGGNSVSYNVYTCTVASPYSSNHRHQITYS